MVLAQPADDNAVFDRLPIPAISLPLTFLSAKSLIARL